MAGASGTGKSTFLRQMRAGNIPREVMAKLPAGAQKWLHLKAGEHSRWLHIIAKSSRRTIPGVILHYELTRRAVLDGKYRDDPALRLLKMAEKITIINFRAPAERLVSQLAHKEFGAQTNKAATWARLKWKFSLLIRAMIIAVVNAVPRNWILQLKRASIIARVVHLINSRKVPRVEDALVKIKLYEQFGWLDRIYDRWQSCLQSLKVEGADIEQIFIETGSAAYVGENYQWQVKSDKNHDNRILADVAGHQV